MKKTRGKTKKKSRKGKKYEKSLSLYGMSFDDVVTRIVKTDPPPKAPKKK
jgi:hypothetical protein